MSEWLASLRTTNGMRLPFPVLVSSRFKWARYKPDTALLGTVHDADTAQFPQSISLVTGGPHGPAAATGWGLTTESRPSSSTASISPMTERRPIVRSRKSSVPDIWAPQGE